MSFYMLEDINLSRYGNIRTLHVSVMCLGVLNYLCVKANGCVGAIPLSLLTLKYCCLSHICQL